MKRNVDLTKSKLVPLSFLNEDEAKNQSTSQKGWSFSYVYHFSEIKDIYLILKNTNNRNPKEIFNNKEELGLKYVKTPWEERRILEQINALKNFGLVGTDNKIIKDVFENETLGSPINDIDLSVFRDIYFSYFRFKEIHSWFTEPNAENRLAALEKVSEYDLENNSKVLFPFSKKGRFTNAFMLEMVEKTDIFYIKKDNDALMRFWDVYVKWGQSLNLLEKFNFKEFDLQFATDIKSLSCVYFKKSSSKKFNLHTFLKKEYRSKYIQIPKLIFKIATKYRFSIEEIKNIILVQSLDNSEHISLQRTSEKFIRNDGEIFFPKYKGSYISHLLLAY